MDKEKLIISNYNRVYGFALKLTNNITSAEDLTQEVMIKALNNKGTFENEYKFRGWLFSITKNQFINDYRKSIRQRDITKSIDDLTNIDATISENCDSLVLTGEIESAFNKIKPEKKECIQMFINGYKYYEIAEILKTSIGSIKSRIHFGRKEFKNHYEK